MFESKKDSERFLFSLRKRNVVISGQYAISAVFPVGIEKERLIEIQ